MTDRTIQERQIMVGSRVELVRLGGYAPGWANALRKLLYEPGVVRDVGEGPHAGEVRVEYPDGTRLWLLRRNLRLHRRL